MPGMGLQTVSMGACEKGLCYPKMSGHLLCFPLLAQEKGILIMSTF